MFAFSGGCPVGSTLGVIVSTLLVYGLLRLICRGTNWDRLVVAGIIGVGLPSALFTFLPAYRRHPGETGIDLISTLTFLIALAILFTKENKRWFSSHSTTGLRLCP